jgi:hypothetical protein
MLTSNHTDPSLCRQIPLHMEYSSCLYGSWRVWLGAVTILRPLRPGFGFYIPGGGAYEFPPSALIYGNVYSPESDFDSGDPDTWAVSPNLGVASHMDYIKEETVRAYEHAQGWKRSLKNIGGSRVVLTTNGKFPVVRPLCGEQSLFLAPPTDLPVPLLNETKFWRSK